MMMMKNIYYYKILPAVVSAVLLLTGCQKEKPVIDPQKPAERVFLMYDNIGPWFDDDVIEAAGAVAAGALEPADRVVVYERMSSGNEIYELVRDASDTNGFKKETVKKYAAGENASLDAETIATVVGDIRDHYPDADEWGFAFGSHGMGWLPASNTVQFARGGDTAGRPHEHPFAELWEEKENPLTRYFSGYNQKLDISEFVDGLDEWDWDFIILDDCFMASVEALYEMRTLADYIIASPTEIMEYGFPYDRVVNSIFDDWSEEGFMEVGREFVDYYRSRSADSASGTVAVVKTSQLDALAETVRRLNLNFADQPSSVDGIQYYEGLIRPGHVFFDLDDYLSTIRKETMPSEYSAFAAQLERTVVFKDYTDTFFSKPTTFNPGSYIRVTYYSGLNVFIPWSSTSSLFTDYQATGWYKAVYVE